MSDGNVGDTMAATASPPPQRSRDDLNELPDDVLLLIFARLDLRSRVKIERVCQRWRHLALQLWRSQRKLSFKGVLSVSRECPTTPDFARALLSRCGVALRSVEFGPASQLLDNRAAEAISMFCPNLEYLDMSGVAVTDEGLQLVAEKCPKLKRVLLRWCFLVGDTGLTSLLALCQNLEHLDLTEVRKLRGECFGVCGPRLRKLVLRSCLRLMSTRLTTIANKCRLLTKLSITNCLDTTDENLLLLCENLKALRVLHLGGLLPNLTSEGICAVSSLSLLEELDLNHMKAVTDITLEAICQRCTLLRSLNISVCNPGITDATCGHLLRCLRLRDVEMSFLDGISSSGLKSLACHGLLKSVKLRECRQVEDSGVLALVELCLNLESLDVSGCLQVTNAAVTGCATLVAERPHKLTLVLGGTSVVFEDLPPGPSQVLEVDRSDTSLYHLRRHALGYAGDVHGIYDYSGDEAESESDVEYEDYFEDAGAFEENDVEGFEDHLEDMYDHEENDVVQDLEDAYAFEGNNVEGFEDYFEDMYGHEENDIAHDFEDCGEDVYDQEENDIAHDFEHCGADVYDHEENDVLQEFGDFVDEADAIEAIEAIEENDVA